MKIGFFDSGLGGLTILKAVVKELPEYDYIYYGDTKHLPYGDRSEAEIYTLTKSGIEVLFSRDCQLVIIACNTASSETLRKLQDTFLVEQYPERRILGVVIPTVEALIKVPTRIAVLLATKRTVDSGKYEIELAKVGSQHYTIRMVPMTELVPLIEANKIDEATIAAVKAIDDATLAVGEVDTIVLGCTHYTMLKTKLREHYGPDIEVISQDEVIPEKLKIYLDNHPEITNKLDTGGGREIVLTEHRQDYDELAAELLGGAFIGR